MPPNAPASFQPASALEKTVYLKALMMGPAGAGKTTIACCTSPRPVGVILCEDDTALNYPRVSLRDDEGMSAKDIDKVLLFTKVGNWEQMMAAVQTARAAAEAGDIKTLVVDPLNFWADRLLDQCQKWHLTKEGNEDGRKAHPELTKRLRQLTYQLLGLPCHVVVVSHYMDVGDAAKRGGPDKVPMLPNKESRAVVHGMFPHKLWMQISEAGKRVFIMTPQGFTGPGVRGYKGASEIEADIGTLMSALSLPGALVKETVAPKAAPSNVRPLTSRPTTPSPNKPTSQPVRSQPQRPTNNVRR